MLRGAAGIAVIVIGIFVFNHFSNSTSSNTAAEVQYVESPVEMGTISNYISASGTLAPADSYSITSLVTGEVLADYFEEGDVVDKDMLLYSIDNEDTEATIEKAEISLSSVERQYSTALSNLDNINSEVELNLVLKPYLGELAY